MCRVKFPAFFHCRPTAIRLRGFAPSSLSLAKTRLLYKSSAPTSPVYTQAEGRHSDGGDARMTESICMASFSWHDKCYLTLIRSRSTFVITIFTFHCLSILLSWSTLTIFRKTFTTALIRMKPWLLFT